jgi:hypothetical protein
MGEGEETALARSRLCQVLRVTVLDQQVSGFWKLLFGDSYEEALIRPSQKHMGGNLDFRRVKTIPSEKAGDRIRLP